MDAATSNQGVRWREAQLTMPASRSPPIPTPASTRVSAVPASTRVAVRVAYATMTAATTRRTGMPAGPVVGAGGSPHTTRRTGRDGSSGGPVLTPPASPPAGWPEASRVTPTAAGPPGPVPDRTVNLERVARSGPSAVFLRLLRTTVLAVGRQPP